MSLRSNDVPLWNVKALIRARYATPDETEHYRNASRDAEAAPGDLLLAYIVDLSYRERDDDYEADHNNGDHISIESSAACHAICACRSTESFVPDVPLCA
jgi:hypothetical protein